MTSNVQAGTAPRLEAVNDFVIKFANVNGSGLGLGQRAVRAQPLAHGRAGQPAQHLPLEHPGPAHLVRGARQREGLPGAARRRRPDGGDEPADLGQGPAGDRARRLPALRQLQADAGVAVPQRHPRARRAAHRPLRHPLHRPARAPAAEEHRLRRRARGDARRRARGDRHPARRAVQGQGQAAPAQPRRLHDGPAPRPRVLRRRARPEDRAPRRGRQAHLHRRQRRRGARLRLRRRDGLRLVSDHAELVAGRGVPEVLRASCASTRRPAGTSSRSSRPRTRSPRSASSSAPAGTARARSPPPPGRASR